MANGLFDTTTTGAPFAGTEHIQQPDDLAYIEIRDGVEYCTLCWKYGSKEHYESYKHSNKVWWWKNCLQSQRSTQQAVPAPSVSAAGPQKDAAVYGAMLASLSPPPGDPSWYSWQARTQTWQCELCWKTADDNHIASTKHKRKVQWMENETLMGALPVPVAGPPESNAVENATLVYPRRPPGDPTWYT